MYRNLRLFHSILVVVSPGISPPETRRWVDGQPSGQGSHTSPDGTSLSGEFRDGRAHGNGTRTDAAGCRYEGEFRLGRRHGRGCLFHPVERCHYSGEWLDDRPFGDGAMWFDGCAARFTGAFCDGRPVDGVWTSASGVEYGVIVGDPPGPPFGSAPPSAAAVAALLRDGVGFRSRFVRTRTKPRSGGSAAASLGRPQTRYYDRFHSGAERDDHDANKSVGRDPESGQREGRRDDDAVANSEICCGDAGRRDRSGEFEAPGPLEDGGGDDDDADGPAGLTCGRRTFRRAGVMRGLPLPGTAGRFLDGRHAAAPTAEPESPAHASKATASTATASTATASMGAASVAAAGGPVDGAEAEGVRSGGTGAGDGMGVPGGGWRPAAPPPHVQQQAAAGRRFEPRPPHVRLPPQCDAAPGVATAAAAAGQESGWEIFRRKHAGKGLSTAALAAYYRQSRAEVAAAAAAAAAHAHDRERLFCDGGETGNGSDRVDWLRFAADMDGAGLSLEDLAGLFRRARPFVADSDGPAAGVCREKDQFLQAMAECGLSGEAAERLFERASAAVSAAAAGGDGGGGAAAASSEWERFRRERSGKGLSSVEVASLYRRFKRDAASAARAAAESSAQASAHIHPESGGQERIIKGGSSHRDSGDERGGDDVTAAGFRRATSSPCAPATTRPAGGPGRSNRSKSFRERWRSGAAASAGQHKSSFQMGSRGGERSEEGGRSFTGPWSGSGLRGPASENNKAATGSESRYREMGQDTTRPKTACSAGTETEDNLGAALASLVGAAAESTESFLRYVYSCHPPRRVVSFRGPSSGGEGNRLTGAEDAVQPGDTGVSAASNAAITRRSILAAIRVYHEDKNPATLHGVAWHVLCREITKLLNAKLEMYK
jgi:hypothetical protein